tara:strand:+ start:1734 stop:2543 length:810 start_codon:yes stop_codon:yes gene_type:complete
MIIGIIGHGVVGKAASSTFKKKYQIIIYDKFQELDKFEKLSECSFVFIMVPTPFDCKKNLVDISAVEESLNRLEKIDYNGIVLIKSTVPPGSCNNFSDKYNLKIVFNPEFLRESTTPNEDFQNQETIVIGTNSKKDFDSVREMYQKVAVSHAKYYHTSASEAEMIKTAQNTMLASRVALANMVFDACLDNSVDYDLVREIAFERFEILGPYMTQVPGPDGKRGFGGKCLPKDIRAFSTIHKSELLENIISYNDLLRDDLDNVLINFKKD